MLVARAARNMPGLVLDAGGLLPPSQMPRGHRLPAAGFIGGNVLVLPRRVAAHPRGGVAGHSLDGPDDHGWQWVLMMSEHPAL